MWSDVWTAVDGVVCLSILLEGEVTVSNNFTKRRQNFFKIGTRDKFATHLRKEYLISIEIVIYAIFFYDRWFSHTILYIHKLSHTPPILSLGSLWCDTRFKLTCVLELRFVDKTWQTRRNVVRKSLKVRPTATLLTKSTTLSVKWRLGKHFSKTHGRQVHACTWAHRSAVVKREHE